jgi:hypothetical protein
MPPTVPYEINCVGLLPVTWEAADAGDGTIITYTLEFRHYYDLISAWGPWKAPVNTIVSDTSALLDLKVYRVDPKDKLQWRIRATNSYHLDSLWVESELTMMNEGRVWFKYSGAWHYAVPFVKVDSAWRIARQVYYKVAGVWKDSL